MISVVAPHKPRFYHRPNIRVDVERAEKLVETIKARLDRNRLEAQAAMLRKYGCFVPYLY